MLADAGSSRGVKQRKRIRSQSCFSWSQELRRRLLRCGADLGRAWGRPSMEEPELEHEHEPEPELSLATSVLP